MSESEKETVITRSKGRANYERIMFCMKAMGGKGNPLFTRYMHIENTRAGSRIVCTDGKRLHAANISVRIPAGNYQPEVKDNCVSFKNPAGIIFPSWKNVVPEDAVFRGTVSLETTAETKSERDEKFSAAYCALLSSAGFSVSIGFFKDLPSAKWNVFAQGGRKQLVKLENAADKNQFAVFAPLAA